jgi:hypothetical protein
MTPHISTIILKNGRRIRGEDEAFLNLLAFRPYAIAVFIVVEIFKSLLKRIWGDYYSKSQ